MRIVFILIGTMLYLPLNANARYTQISVDGNRFCGLLETGELECTAANNPAPEGFQDIPNDSFVAMDVSNSYTCAITSAGALECWGTVSDGETSPPEFDSPVVSLSQSFHHACALDSNGVAKCWGQNVHGQATAPVGINDFVDVDTFGFYNSCGVRSTGEVLCWGRSGDNFLPEYFDTINPSPFVDIEFTPAFSTDIGCGLRADGTAECWRASSNIVLANFRDGPYKKVFPLTEEQQYTACALSVTGEIDCAERSGNVIRLTDSFQDADQFNTSLFGYTTGGQLVEITNNITFYWLSLIDIVNGELEMPSMTITGGEYYGGTITELFFNVGDASIAHRFRQNFDTQIFRDGELLTTTDNLGSYTDRTVVPGADHTYTVRSVHQFGQVGELSNAQFIPANRDYNSHTDDTLIVDRPLAPQNLRGEVYWYDVELFWDRDFTNTVRNYEIRRDGEMIDTSRGTSWYDNSGENGQSYQYDVLAIGYNDQILGISSVHIQIGPAECR